MAGLVPAIHVRSASARFQFAQASLQDKSARRRATTWMPGTSPGKTAFPSVASAA